MRRLASQLVGEVDTSSRRRAEYSSDASNYRVVPQGVVFPRTIEDVVATVRFCREESIPLTGRGGGTSVAGNAIGPGLVIDLSRHLTRISQMDPGSRTAVVEPGVVALDLQLAAQPRGLRFGPDPSTQSRCTLGGMIGNNACGPRAAAFGRTSDAVRALTIVDGRGEVRELGVGHASMPGLGEFTQRHLATIRTSSGRFARQASGYALEHLLPEHNRDVAKAFVGSEGSCGIVLSATVALTPVPASVTTAVLGYPDLVAAAVDAQRLTHPDVLAVEGLDGRIRDLLVAHGRTVPPLPLGEALLCIEVAGNDEVARQLARGSSAQDYHIVTDPRHAAAVWRMRSDGAGFAGRTIDGSPAWPGFEDAAVPPAQLARYLAEFRALTASFGLDGIIYGHFADGCVHTRLDLPLATDPARCSEFLVESAKLVVRHGGSLSGEHGDGRARSALLPLMYDDAALNAFREFRALFDPDAILNPGVLVDPAPLLNDLRLANTIRLPARGFALSSDRADLAMAAHRCTGAGVCRSTAMGFMCPSYRATRDEKDTTRGRARILQEVASSVGYNGDWRRPEVAESLDLCLSCKACRSECPTGIDMAAYKAEFLDQRYRRRVRPLTHYTLGRLPVWLRAARLAPGASSAALRSRIIKRALGIDPRRALPVLAPTRMSRNPTRPGDVVLVVDGFTRTFSPGVVASARSIIESLGQSVSLVADDDASAITWISTGQLATARRRLRRLLSRLDSFTESGCVLIGLEPSTVATMRSDLLELLPSDPRARRVSESIKTLAEYLVTHDWRPPSLAGRALVVQPHCHHHAVLGFAADLQLLRATGAQLTVVEGCCGMAGNFGMEREHYDVSLAIAELGVVGELRNQPPECTVVADGFSCRTQVADILGRRSIHLAELLDPHAGNG